MGLGAPISECRRSVSYGVRCGHDSEHLREEMRIEMEQMIEREMAVMRQWYRREMAEMEQRLESKMDEMEQRRRSEMEEMKREMEEMKRQMQIMSEDFLKFKEVSMIRKLDNKSPEDTSSAPFCQNAEPKQYTCSVCALHHPVNDTAVRMTTPKLKRPRQKQKLSAKKQNKK